MGESDSSMMGDSEATLEVSVSFGRFENDLLAWEKWSTFPTNKYLEEVGKCSTPGSVAQKKAYFEAHYKKIAARKAEQEEQDEKIEDEASNPADSEVQAQSNLVAKFCEAEQALDAEKESGQNAASEIELGNEVAKTVSEISNVQMDEPKEALNDQKSVGKIELEVEGINSEKDIKDSVQLLDAEKINEMNYVSVVEVEDEVTNSANEMRSDEADEPKQSLDMTNGSKDVMLLIDEVKDESCCEQVNPELHETEEPSLVKDRAPSSGFNGEIISVNKIEKDKSDKILKSKKATTTKKASNTTPLKKKPAASTPKSSVYSTPKFSRSALSKSTMSDSRSSSKKEYGTSPLINKKPSRTESRRVAPTSLHMSMSLGPDRPANSEPAAITTMRKSVFMEKMGDKDIVKRAFRAFRNDFNQLSVSSPEKPTLGTQVPGKETGMKASVIGTPQKKTEGIKNVVKKTPQSIQQGIRKTSTSTSTSTRVSHTAAGADQRNVKSISSTYGLRSLDKTDKRKEFSKKPEEKGNGKAAERTQSESKVKKEMGIKSLPYDHSTKAKPTVGTTKLKSSLDKKSTT